MRGGAGRRKDAQYTWTPTEGKEKNEEDDAGSGSKWPKDGWLP